MRRESAAGEPTHSVPADLGPDRAAFLTAIAREAERRPPGDPVREVLERPAARDLWDRFAALVYQRSSKLAIVAAGDRRKIYTRHILDSLNLLDVLDPVAPSLLDVGSGAGFPGIPLAIAWPETRVLLLEARERKVGFLEQAVRALGLRNAVPIAGRLEDPALDGRLDPVHAVTVRAVGGLPGLLRHSARVARPGARWAYFAGSREAAAGILPSLAGDQLPARVREGSFGGVLLVGAFHSAT